MKTLGFGTCSASGTEILYRFLLQGPFKRDIDIDMWLSGLLLRNLIQVTIVQKPYCLLYISIMVM